MSVSFEEYLDYMERLGQVLDDLAEQARAKTAAVVKGDLQRVDACMRKEQAMSLTLRALDKKRGELLNALGLTGVSLSELPQRCPDAFRPQTKTAVEQLQNRYQLYRSASEVAMTTLECNLHQIEKYMKEEPGDMPPAGTLADIRA